MSSLLRTLTRLPGLPQRLSEQLVRRQFANLRQGRLTLRTPDGAVAIYGEAGAPDLCAEVTIEDPRAWSLLLIWGSVGAAEAYWKGWWTTPSPDQLTALIRLFVRNGLGGETIDGFWSRLLTPLLRIPHALRRNTRRGSKENILSHYDLGNDFFSLFLDETLSYSSAVFEHPDDDLATASRNKLERICRKLDLRPTDHLLEIGTGWGGLSIYAAREFGCRVTTTTISDAQHALARQRVAEAGLSDRVTVLNRDYRELTGRYDKLVSVEMIEAVGAEYYPTFFAQCSRLLTDEGRMLLQAITIADQRFDEARRSVDVIKRFVFPGSCIPSVTALCQAAAGNGDVRLADLEDITRHYALTLRAWRQNFLANEEAIAALGHDEAFRRLWLFYLCYCEGGFSEGYIGDVQMVFSKPGDRRELRAPIELSRTLVSEAA